MKAKPKLEKFYIRSGKNQLVILAKSPEEGVLRFVQKTLQPSIVVAKDLTKQPSIINQTKLPKLLAKLGRSLYVSQKGFTTAESGEFVTEVVVTQWRKQVASMEKLIRKMK